MVEIENSSDLYMGRRPNDKSDEFSISTISIIELFAFLYLKPPKRLLYCLGALPGEILFGTGGDLIPGSA